MSGAALPVPPVVPLGRCGGKARRRRAMRRWRRAVGRHVVPEAVVRAFRLYVARLDAAALCRWRWR